MKKAYKIAISASVVVVFVISSFYIYISADTGVLASISHIDSKMEALSPQKVSVDGVKLYTQPNGFTCGVTTQSVVTSFLAKKDLPPQLLMEKYQITGSMSHEKFVDIIAKELPDYEVTYQHDQSDFDLVKAIHQQLKNGVPVPVFFGAANPYNKPLYDFHASVVTGLDLNKQNVDILNVYGYEEHISLTEFLNRMSYRGAKDYPIVQRTVVKLGLMDRNSLILLKQK